jgi:hypothetical protein
MGINEDLAIEVSRPRFDPMQDLNPPSDENDTLLYRPRIVSCDLTVTDAERERRRSVMRMAATKTSAHVATLRLMDGE